jgi:hypothetical protein
VRLECGCVWATALPGAGHQLNRPVTISTFNGCAFLGASWSDESEAKREQCRGYVDGTLRWLDRSPPGVVVIGISDSLWVAPHVAVGQTRATESEDPQTKARYLASDFSSVVNRLRRAGQKVMIMQPIPKPIRLEGGEIKLLFDPERCSVFAVVERGCPQPVESSLELEDKMQAVPRQTISSLSTRPGVGMLDLRSFFCRRGQCSTHRGDVLLYRDAGHITVQTSRALAGIFSDAIRRL